jgi:hypothetical protein
MATVTYDLDRDVRTAESMAARLTPYIYENELYGHMPNDLAKLTVGGLLMRLHRLKAISNQLSPHQQEAVKSVQAQFDDVERNWRVALEGKLQREFQARLTAMHQYVNEYIDNPTLFKENYYSAAEKRVILEALADEAKSLDYMVEDIKGALLSLDNKMRRYLEKGDFIWDKRLQVAYPAEKYWFLYVS